MPKQKLARSLHLLTSAVNVARYVATKEQFTSGVELARRALLVLNPDYAYSATELQRFQKGRTAAADLVRATKDNDAKLAVMVGQIVDACDAILAK